MFFTGGKMELKDVLPEAEKFCADVIKNRMPQGYELRTKLNRKYIKIISVNECGHSSAWGFINDRGEILKAENWHKPADGSRGSIYAPFAWQQVEWTGPRYFIGGNKKKNQVLEGKKA